MKLVIFDNDGTLVNTEVISVQSLVSMAERLGVPITFEEADQRFTGRKLTDCIAEIEQAGGRAFTQDELATQSQFFVDTLEKGLDAMPGAMALLGSLELPLCVASNADLSHVNQCMRLTGLEVYVPPAVRFSAYDINVWKPDPDLFLHAASQMGVAPTDCVVIEDSSVGMQAGVRAGMTVLGYTPHGAPVDAPDGVHFYQHHDQVLSILAGLSR